MAWWIDALLAFGAGMLLAWLLLIGILWRAGRARPDLVETVRLLPDLVRLLSRLARDRSLSCGVRARLWLLLGYLVLPIDIVPDFLPLIGYADDAIIVGLVLRSVVRSAGFEALEAHWPGSPDGLRAVLRIAGLTAERG